MNNNQWIPGTFGQKKIYYDYLESTTPSNIVIVFFHGVYSSTYNHPMYKYFAKAIVKKGLANVALYETSRKIQSWEKPDEWQMYVDSFTGKTFEDELEDVKTIIKYIDDMKKKDTHFFFIGSSLGGTLLSYLLPKYKNRVKSVVLLGSGITTNGKEQPILSTYPSSHEILDNYKMHSGNITLIQGTNDETVPTKPARRIISQDSQALIKKLIILNGVDHRFTTIFGENRAEEIKKTLLSIIEYELSIVI